MRIACALLALSLSASLHAADIAQWPQIGNDAGGGRYSPLTQIDAHNVTRLKPKWVYHHGDFAKGENGAGATAFEATPLMVDGTLYFCTPYNRIVALDAASGAERWTHDPHANLKDVYSKVCRGVAYWADDSAAAGAACATRIFEATLDARLIAVDARTGKACEGFGEHGAVNLLHGLGEVRAAEYYPTSAPLVIDGVVLTNAFVKDNQRANAPGGGIRAWDARSGALRWVWDSVPPTMHAVTADEIARGATLTPGTPNSWALMSADPQNHLVFVPTGSAAPDHYGGAERQGLDYYGESIVALDSRSGAVRWHFQTVHHDLWDYDLAAQPVTYLHDGTTPAVIAATKLGFVFLLDRLSGAPLFPVEERKVPASTVPGEHASPTQPFPTKPAPLHPLSLTRDELWGLTFWDRGKCRDAFDALDYEGAFTPPSLRGALEYPGLGGGINWGSVSVDPVRRRMVVNLQTAPFTIKLVPRAQFDGAMNGGDLVAVGPEDGTPYVVVRGPFLSPLKTPCVPPPWGKLVAIDLDSGEKLWERPLGNLHGMAPFGDRFETGTPNSGGSMQTASGLVFIAATMDSYIRAFDADDGAELWRFELPFGGHGVPITYRVKPDGPQYVVIAAGGHGALGDQVGDAVVAFTLDGK